MEETIEKKGRGRPKKGDGYTERVEMRVSEDESKILDQLEAVTGCSRSEIIRKSFHGYYAYLKEVGLIGDGK